MKRYLGILCFLLFLPSMAAAQAKSVVFVSVTPVVDTGAYSTGEVMGGILDFQNAFKSAVGSGILLTAEVVDNAAQAVDLDLYLFDRSPSTSTTTDQSAFDLADAEQPYLLGVINFGSASRFAAADNSTHQVLNQLIPVQGRTSTGAISRSVYGVLVARGAYDGAAATDITVRLGILQN